MGIATAIASPSLALTIMTANASQDRELPSGPWQPLLEQAFTILDDLKLHSGVADPFWTLGGGTVLMLRYGHRLSKDIDIFVPDPQYLGFVTPRLSDIAANVTTDYVEAATFVKLIRSEGEIDFVAAPNLTSTPFDTWPLLGRPVKVETAAEIVAKKLWHRGDMATARDLFDLALVIDKEPEQLKAAAAFLTKHRSAFLTQLEQRRNVLKTQFEAIDALNFKPSFDQALSTATQFLRALSPYSP
jgi:hypothetical protein